MAKSNSQVTTLDDGEVAAAEAATIAPATVVGANHDEVLSGERKMLTIHQSDADGGAEAVFVGLNGYGYQIPRGTPHLVPVEVIKILQNAKTKMLSNGVGGAIIERDVPRFAFSVE